MHRILVSYSQYDSKSTNIPRHPHIVNLPTAIPSIVKILIFIQNPTLAIVNIIAMFSNNPATPISSHNHLTLTQQAHGYFSFQHYVTSSVSKCSAVMRHEMEHKTPDSTLTIITITICIYLIMSWWWIDLEHPIIAQKKEYISVVDYEQYGLHWKNWVKWICIPSQFTYTATADSGCNLIHLHGSLRVSVVDS